jgi:2-C-methyl-D-erythritol 4-phosphate cytidylyltransferase
MHYWLVMPAAGAGQRFGGEQPKQHAPLAGRTVLELALEPFLADARCRGLVLVVAAGELDEAQRRWRKEPRIRVVAGGARRCDSVLAGLDALAGHNPDDALVLVHDAARPCLAQVDLDSLLAAGAAADEGALLAAPVSDTLKRAGADGRAEATVERAGLWRALTPQRAPLGRLRLALRAALARGAAPSDEAQALEWAGARPLLVAAREANPKITLAGDLPLAEALLARRRGEQR